MGFKFNPFTGTLDLVDTTKSSTGTYNRSGNVPKNTWLLNNEIPSNKSGFTSAMSNSVIRKISTSNEDPDVIELELYTHDGDGINLTLLGSVTTAAQRSNTFSVSLMIPAGKQLAVKTANVTGNTGKNLLVSAVIKGTLS